VQKLLCGIAFAALSFTAACATPPAKPNVVVDTFVVHVDEKPMTSDSNPKVSPDEEKALLTPYRARIDVLDAKIVALLGERFDVIREVAVLKAVHGIAPILPDRVEQVVQHAREKAEKAGIDPNLVERIYRIIIDTACKEEEEYAKAQQTQTLPVAKAK
jgi:isochorismate pyruvate lyase